jgi:hypothetical protein
MLMIGGIALRVEICCSILGANQNASMRQNKCAAHGFPAANAGRHTARICDP